MSHGGAAGGSAGRWRAVLIAGPTASGKSALAVRLAEAFGGMVVNADSMQVYADLRVLTARPSAEDEARAPHRLYGHVDAGRTYSTGAWLEDVRGVLAEAERAGRLPILVGGTGLYFKLLTEGIAAMPPIPPGLRALWRERLASGGAPALHAELSRRDPQAAARLRGEDGVRIVRALEVLDATGRSITAWQRENSAPLLPADCVLKTFLAPDRPVLQERIDARFDAMLGGGALDEVRSLAARGLDPLMPAMKAHGVPWLLRHIAGEVSLQAAAAGAKADTRRYAKRQFTWFRNQLPGWPWTEPSAAFGALRTSLAG